MTERMWYFAVGSQQEGPIVESELKGRFDSGALSRTTLVWSDKLTNWTAAAELEEFAPPPAPPMPPPLPQAPVPPPMPAAPAQSVPPAPSAPVNPFAQPQTPVEPVNPFAQPQNPSTPVNPFAQPQSQPSTPVNPFTQAPVDDQQATRPMANNPFAKPSFGQPPVQPAPPQPGDSGSIYAPPPQPGPSFSQGSNTYGAPNVPPSPFGAGYTPQFGTGSSWQNRPRPWIRWFARGIDFYLYQILFNIVCVIAAFLANVAGPVEFLRFAISTVVMAIGWVSCFILLEPILVATWGTTVGKAIASIRVTNQDESPLSFQQAFARYFALLVRTGFLASFFSIFLTQFHNPVLMGISYFLLFTQIGLCIYQYFQLQKNEITSWDRDNNVKYRVPDMDSVQIAILSAGYVVALGIFAGTMAVAGWIIGSMH